MTSFRLRTSVCTCDCSKAKPLFIFAGLHQTGQRKCAGQSLCWLQHSALPPRAVRNLLVLLCEAMKAACSRLISIRFVCPSLCFVSVCQRTSVFKLSAKTGFSIENFKKEIEREALRVIHEVMPERIAFLSDMCKVFPPFTHFFFITNKTQKYYPLFYHRNWRAIENVGGYRAPSSRWNLS
jgi:hypothetical protein